MHLAITDFSIYTDAIESAKNGYAAVFSCCCNTCNQADFIPIKIGQSEHALSVAALASSTYSPIIEKTIGFEYTIGVNNMDSRIAMISQHRSEMLLHKKQSQCNLGS